MHPGAEIEIAIIYLPTYLPAYPRPELGIGIGIGIRTNRTNRTNRPEIEIAVTHTPHQQPCLPAY